MASDPPEEADEAPPPSKGKVVKEKKGGSIVSTIIAVFILTILAAAGGGFLGLQVYSTVETAAQEKLKAQEAEKKTAYEGDLTVRPMPPIITNLASPESTWLRLEASLVFDGPVPEGADALVTQISGDALGYIRTLSASNLEGSAGLLYLREDLTERAKIRSEGKVREVVILSLVVE